MPRFSLRLIAVLLVGIFWVGGQRVDAQAQTQPDGSLVYVVQAGDTVDGIAFAYGVTRADIMSLNNLTDPRLIQIGQRLIVRPAPDPVAEDAAANNEAASAEGAAEGSAEASDVEGASAEANTAPRSPLDDPNAIPAAPIIGASSGVLPPFDPAAATARVCIELFDDANQNRIHDGGEVALIGGHLSLVGEFGTFETDANGEPFCLDAIQPGVYIANATAPTGYGLTTPAGLRVDARPGTDVQIAFGAALGAVIAPVPTVDIDAVVDSTVVEPIRPPQSSTPSNIVRDNLGWIAFGLAGIVLIGGMGAALLARNAGRHADDIPMADSQEQL